LQVKLEKMEADLEAENPWERVINLVDMQVGIPTKKKRTLHACIVLRIYE
jgi:hypothetical protein